MENIENINIDDKLKDIKEELKQEIENKKNIESELRLKEEENRLNKNLKKDIENANNLDNHVDNHLMLMLATGGLSGVLPLLKDLYKIMEAEFNYFEELKVLKEKYENQALTSKMVDLKNDEKLLKDVIKQVLTDDFSKNDGKIIDKIENYLKSDKKEDNKLIEFLASDKKTAHEFIIIKKIGKMVNNIFNDVNKKLNEVETKLDIKIENVNNLDKKEDKVDEIKEVKKENRKENTQKMRMRR